ncbi:YpdA family putative bacillithiol disulfide reductase [Paenibacillus validus]|uniref:YpdA family putative bacillithiol disulfide reductase n=1 Tax=Paenibacillus validus TaxID=44253 RepID=A0A7X2Z7D4_9BACL|nr:YpdA family putative bacillithiol disulfide reductase [Paenibacillus validus]MUG69703.1 YpdA family putative bacillithiol disulfide reductase [Paenibacillus validus]
MEEAVVIGAGPCGLSAAIELQKIGIDPLLIEKENVVHSIYLYPTYMQFFSTPELLEIGDYPFSTPNEKPTRQEALTYYRTVASRRQLRVRPYQRVTEIGTAGDGAYKLTVADASGRVNIVEARHVIVATGYFDQPNLLGIPGEQLPKVSHYFREAHPYAGTKVTVIGGSNSAVDAAMELLRAGAEVTVVYRGDTYSPVIKPWVRPIFESMVNKERIRMWFGSRVTRIDEASVTVVKDGQEHTIENDFVLALTGFHPDRSLLRAVGAAFRDDDEVPLFDPETMETTCPGIYIAGVAASGRNANEVFIETGRNHGVWIARHIASKR